MNAQDAIQNIQNQFQAVKERLDDELVDLHQREAKERERYAADNQEVATQGIKKLSALLNTVTDETERRSIQAYISILQDMLTGEAE